MARTDPARDYHAEMRALFDRNMRGDEPYNAAALAHKIVEDLRHRDPDLLAGWLDTLAEDNVRTVIAKIDASSRGHARAVAGRRVFGSALAAHEAGDTTAFSRWLDARFTVGEDQLRKPLRSMTRTECTAVADDYDTRARRNALQAQFLRAVAKRVTGTKTVADVFSEQQLNALWGTLSGEEEPAAGTTRAVA